MHMHVFYIVHVCIIYKRRYVYRHKSAGLQGREGGDRGRRGSEGAAGDPLFSFGSGSQEVRFQGFRLLGLFFGFGLGVLVGSCPSL